METRYSIYLRLDDGRWVPYALSIPSPNYRTEIRNLREEIEELRQNEKFNPGIEEWLYISAEGEIPVGNIVAIEATVELPFDTLYIA